MIVPNYRSRATLLSVIFIGVLLASLSVACPQLHNSTKSRHKSEPHRCKPTRFKFGELTSAWGQSQVAAMLADRPQMALVTTVDGSIRKLNSRDPIWMWAVEQFSEELAGGRVAWRSEEPSDVPNGVLGTCHFSPNRGGGHIRLARGKFEELWSTFVFEMHNIRSRDLFLALYDQARKLEIWERDFVKSAISIEHKSLLDLKRYYREHWLPWARHNDVATDPSEWHMDTLNSAIEWFYRVEEERPSYVKYWQKVWGQLARIPEPENK